MDKPINSFTELKTLIKKLKPGEEMTVQAPYSTRSDIVFNLLIDEAYTVAASVPSNNNRYYLFESKHATVAINDGNDDFFEDIIITNIKGQFRSL